MAACPPTSVDVPVFRLPIELLMETFNWLRALHDAADVLPLNHDQTFPPFAIRIAVSQFSIADTESFFHWIGIRRITRLHIDTPSEETYGPILSILCKLTAPKLSDFELLLEGQMLLELFPNNIFSGEYLPNLSFLRLHGVPYLPTFFSPDITTFDLSLDPYAWTDVVDILNALNDMPLLQSLKLRQRIPAPPGGLGPIDEANSHHVSLPFLRRLDLEGASDALTILCDHTTANELQNFTVRPVIEDSGQSAFCVWHCHPLTRYIPRLRHLRLANVDVGCVVDEEGSRDIYELLLGLATPQAWLEDQDKRFITLENCVITRDRLAVLRKWLGRDFLSYPRTHIESSVASP
ncbi:hypothetical protein K488DRAFT_83196 [Vararia minispora EC-137]|uniref:Uncharacterized protein n=1 Tax=Vararia minispora EC-137 TaxID=1314806 RepID=A0ACB8QTU2_9AGAM|nr:hypothetical protein K488DRAFT_83196 [Vararia minispora EC-137]